MKVLSMATKRVVELRKAFSQSRRSRLQNQGRLDLVEVLMLHRRNAVEASSRCNPLRPEFLAKATRAPRIALRASSTSPAPCISFSSHARAAASFMPPRITIWSAAARRPRQKFAVVLEILPSGEARNRTGEACLAPVRTRRGSWRRSQERVAESLKVNPSAGGTSAVIAVEVIGPTPGIVINRRAVGSDFER
jgi:hypothetical protein